MNLNVNLKKCDCPANQHHRFSRECASVPVLIPCPIRRSVTFEVALGECTELCSVRPSARDVAGGHIASCPARPVKVSCSISGETWEGGEVDEEAVEEAETRPEWTTSDHALEIAVCRERWALIKALVLGSSSFVPSIDPGAQNTLMLQRDTVFAALADMAMDERHHAEKMATLPERVRPVLPAYAAPSEEALSRYVEHLIEQVGVL